MKFEDLKQKEYVDVVRVLNTRTQMNNIFMSENIFVLKDNEKELVDDSGVALLKISKKDFEKHYLPNLDKDNLPTLKDYIKYINKENKELKREIYEFELASKVLIGTDNIEAIREFNDLDSDQQIEIRDRAVEFFKDSFIVMDYLHNSLTEVKNRESLEIIKYVINDVLDNNDELDNKSYSKLEELLKFLEDYESECLEEIDFTDLKEQIKTLDLTEGKNVDKFIELLEDELDELKNEYNLTVER